MRVTRAGEKRAFLITIDTEGDNLWARPSTITTRNAEYLPRFQVLCERYRLKPTYLVNWEMAQSPAFREFGRDILARAVGEIGMHLHAWDSPPIVPLTRDDRVHHPYLFEYPLSVMRDKVKVLTSTLEDAFGCKIISHRAGRWGFNEVYAGVLLEHGYRVDCSVTPHISWKGNLGDPAGTGGSDFRRFPEAAYFMNLDDISVPGDSPLLEVPVSIRAIPRNRAMRRAQTVLKRTSWGGRVVRNLLPEYRWLRPLPRRGALVPLLERFRREERPYAEFMMHSSEFMPGGSPYFPTVDNVDRLYDQLEQLFSVASTHYEGLTLAEYYARLAPVCAPV